MNTLAQKLLTTKAAFSHLPSEVVTVCQHLNHPLLRIAVFAPFNHGKSTLLNALLGSRALPVDLIPTTGTAITIEYGEQLQTQIHLRNGEVVCDRGTRILQEYAVLDGDRCMREDVASITVSCPYPLLAKQVTLIDLPGTSDMEAQDKLVYNQLLTADLVISILDARKLLTMAETDRLQEWLLHRGIQTAIFVLNFNNLIPDASDRKTIATHARFIAQEFRGFLPKYLSNLYQVDALPALRAKVKGEINLAAQSGIFTFESALHEITDFLLPRLQQVRLPRVYALGDRVRQTLQQEFQTLKNEIRVIDRNRALALQQEQEVLTQLENAFRKSVAVLDAWLAWDNLVDTYQVSMIDALKQQTFSTWVTGTFQSAMNSLVADVNKYVAKACDRLGKTRPMGLSFSLPPAPTIDLPAAPATQVGNAGTVVGGAAMGAFIGSFIPGIGTLIGAGIGSLLSHGSSESAKEEWAKYTDQCGEAYAQCAKEYLQEFSQQARSVLQKYHELWGSIFVYQPDPESLEVLKKRKTLSQLDAHLRDLEVALIR